MELTTILNRCQPHKGFVYQQARFSADPNGIEVVASPPRGSAAICSRAAINQRPATINWPSGGFSSPLWGLLIFLLYAMRRVNCPRCAAVVIEEVPWADGKRQLTKAYMLILARWALGQGL
jgi:transposase